MTYPRNAELKRLNLQMAKSARLQEINEAVKAGEIDYAEAARQVFIAQITYLEDGAKLESEIMGGLIQ